jgi:hypothetical protein
MKASNCCRTVKESSAYSSRQKASLSVLEGVLEVIIASTVFCSKMPPTYLPAWISLNRLISQSRASAGSSVDSFTSLALACPVTSVSNKITVVLRRFFSRNFVCRGLGGNVEVFGTVTAALQFGHGAVTPIWERVAERC